MDQTPLLFGIHGVKLSGKDAAFKAVQKYVDGFGWTSRQRGLADMVKWTVARTYIPDITMREAINWCDKWKERPEEVMHAPHFRGKTVEITMRKALQHMGTEVGRDLLSPGSMFWTDLLLPFPDNFVAERWQARFDYTSDTHVGNEDKVADFCGVTDIRFENEAMRVQDLGEAGAWPVLVKIKRKKAEQAIIDAAAKEGREIHRSELGLPDEKFDYVVDNDGDLEELAEKMCSIVNVLIDPDEKSDAST